MLTATEAAGLDLYGTELVVLSACETGVGKAASGEGLYGLKRALVMAGARSQAATLWKVGDDATAALMSAWYRRLRRGEDRVDALRAVQRAQLERAGVPPTAVRVAPWCTACSGDLFFSYRREGRSAGRMMACIGRT